MSSSLTTCRKGEALIYNPWCPSLQAVEGELNNNLSHSVNSEPLEQAAAFLYLVRTITYKNGDWADLYQNL